MKRIVCTLLLLSIFILLCSCSGKNDDTVIRIGTLSGPTGMGMAKLIEDETDGGSYEFTVYQDPQKATADFLAGDLDAVCLPTNTAALLAQKNPGAFSVAAVNCLGSLFVLVKDGSICDSVGDLEGKTVYTSVPNSTTNPILSTILNENGIRAGIETEVDHDALTAKIVKGEPDFAVLPEPKVSAVLSKVQNYRVALDLSAEWDKISDGSLTMGCLVIRNDFIDEHAGIVGSFLEKYQNSVDFISNLQNSEDSCTMIADSGILPNAAIANSALNRLSASLVLLTGEDMKQNLISFYSVLLDQMPQSIGNSLPPDDFYYLGKAAK